MGAPERHLSVHSFLRRADQTLLAARAQAGILTRLVAPVAAIDTVAAGGLGACLGMEATEGPGGRPRRVAHLAVLVAAAVDQVLQGLQGHLVAPGLLAVAGQTQNQGNRQGGQQLISWQPEAAVEVGTTGVLSELGPLERMAEAAGEAVELL